MFQWLPLLFISNWFYPSTKQPQWKKELLWLCSNVNVWSFIWSRDVILLMEAPPMDSWAIGGEGLRQAVRTWLVCACILLWLAVCAFCTGIKGQVR